jgi:ligand-binding SRPBCC domain-containing protein
MKIFEFHSSLWLPRPRLEIFEFFSEAANLQEITPTFLHFQLIAQRPAAMQKGTEIDYRIKIRGIPVRWRSKIALWEPPQRFIDEQLRGPYRLWIHEHRFSEDSGGTICEDHVRYAPIGGGLVNTLFVARDIRNIFEYRSARLKSLFP